MTLPAKHLFALFRRSISSAAAVSAVRCSNKIHGQYRLFIVQESQKALTEYLHATQGLPFFFADQIANNSLFSLSTLLRKVRFSAPDFPTTIRKYLRYQAINEFEFFFESIGIDHRRIPLYLPRDRFFLSSDGEPVLEASMALFQFGFPWNTLGRLYAKKASIFNTTPDELVARLDELRDSYGFPNLPLVGVCLAFPELLVNEPGDFESLFTDTKKVFEKFDDNGSFSEGDLDSWYEVCCKLRSLYELGCEKGRIWESMCSEKRILLDCPKQVLDEKTDYFCGFFVPKDKVGNLLLRDQELLLLDLRTSVISVFGLLEHFGLDSKESRNLSSKYPHVFGRNRMSNLPGTTRALDLHEWFFEKIETFGSQRVANYTMDPSCDREVDQKFQEAFTRLETKRSRSKITTKLEFLMRLGFGENELTVNVLRGMQAANGELQERFDHLLSLGIEYSEVCLMMKIAPRILCLTPELVKKKVDYLCNEMGSSIKGLDPRVLVHDLENRVKPRHRIFVWLRENGLCSESYSIKSIVDLSEKRFIALVLSIHRAAPKLYLECYLRKR